MTAFAAAAAVLLALALVIVLRPFFRKQAASGVLHEQANLDICRDQFNEIETDLRSGALSLEQYEKARLDLERRVLEETIRPAGERGWVRTGLGLPFSIAMLIPLLAVLLYLQLGTPEGLAVASHTARNAPSITPEQFDDMTAKLAARLESNPNDAEGWMMLGRAYRVLERYQDATGAFSKAAALKPGDANLLTDYAEVLALAGGRKLAGEPARLLERALGIDPGNDKALALSGSAAFERKDYKAAIRHWETLLRQPGVSGELAQALQTGIGEARALSQGGRAAPTPSAAGRVTGTVSLDASLRAAVSSEDTVFVFARAAQGPRMPLAIVKVKVKDLPYRFSLDDSMAMLPDMKLSAFPQVIVGARVSKSGSATPAPGDFEGISGVVKPGAGAVKVAINQAVR